ncbi:acyl-CoA dehydrogenase family protein [Rhodococcus erythropolis]|uniref:acyl-CoA dehydrogenase family protein n=1 Tax=Rhodococcus erythropolis TaxID=1833 RepID=UPI0024B78ED7|nr:acyl-CoA dehydrogenase family protein [Rhodococcus erythropolis]MDJ0015503.1 acyl-CoA dehydrogenase family protein [Rhodococcus erythropolis]
MKRRPFNEDHDAFRESVRAFVEKEVQPHYRQWAERGLVDRAVYKKATQMGLVGLQLPEEFGGPGEQRYSFNAAFIEETILGGANLGSLRVHSEVCLPYLLHYANAEQRQRWFPQIVQGDLILALAMTEPGTGSDVAGVATSARLEGDHYVLNGAKTFITGGANADRVLVVCRTSKQSDNRRAGLTILVVDTKSEGFVVGRKLDKIGLKAQDTVELSFNDVMVPRTDLLGKEGEAFSYLAHNLAQERLTIAVAGQASAVRALQLAVDYARERKVFGSPLAGYQNTKFVLAECATDIAAGQALVDQAIEALDTGELTPGDAARVKLFVSEMQQRVVDKCLQVHGGYGYVTEYEIAGLYADARVTRIFGGTSEVMKGIIAKSIGL